MRRVIGLALMRLGAAMLEPELRDRMVNAMRFALFWGLNPDER